MKTEWDYSKLAPHYGNRPDYSDAAIDAMLRVAGLGAEHGQACDVGAGTGHLTRMLCARLRYVVAVEPNDRMREYGAQCTAHATNVRWVSAVGEHTGMSDSEFELVSFGSSFNVLDRIAALREAARVLRPQGWIACMWNHRDLDDQVQAEVERIIHEAVPGYSYGSRREDQTDVICSSGLFGPVIALSSRIRHRQAIGTYLDAWRSHATLERQAGDRFEAVISRIAGVVEGAGGAHVDVPYTTRVWMAQLA